MREPKEIVAVAVRVEHDQAADKVFLVFEIIDENFKRRIKADWMQDIDLELVQKGLVVK